MFPLSSTGSSDRVLTDLDFHGIHIRRATELDGDAVRRLALLDSRPAPSGHVLVAEVGGELLAAIARGGTHPVADPFRPTADVVRLLELRAAQLWGTDPAPAHFRRLAALQPAEARI